MFDGLKGYNRLVFIMALEFSYSKHHSTNYYLLGDASSIYGQKMRNPSKKAKQNPFRHEYVNPSIIGLDISTVAIL